VIGGVRLTVRRTSAPGPGSFPAGRPAAGELEAFGLRALDTVGARLAIVFLATALAGILVAVSPGSSHVGWAFLGGVAVAGCGAGIAVVLVERWAAPWLLALAVAAAATTAVMASIPPGISWDQSNALAGWVVAGLSSGVAASRGPGWGLAVFLPSVVTGLAVEHAHGHPGSALIFLGSLTYYAGGAVTHVLARRGFATTERALGAVEAAQTAQRVAEERWQARREADRLLHDTVLATLTVLAHEGVGVAPAEIRAACARDLAVLTGSASAVEDAAVTGPAPVGREPAHGTTLGEVVSAASAHAAALGLRLAAHLGSPDRPEIRLDPLAASALNNAVAECITNVRRHAGVGRLDLIASITSDALVVLVIDQGRGFDPAAVPADRLGLRASVQERLSPLGGSVAVWSRPGQGTSVKLRLPLPAATS
jgi:signal transduction histidine kinase